MSPSGGISFQLLMHDMTVATKVSAYRLLFVPRYRNERH